MPTARLRLSNVWEVGLSANIAKHTKVGMIWVAGRSPTLVSQNLKATTLTYLAIASHNCPKAQQSLSSVLPCTPSTKYSIAWYRYCNYKHYLDSTT